MTANGSTQRRDGDGTRTRDRRDHKEETHSARLPETPREQALRETRATRVRLDLTPDVRTEYAPVDLDKLIEQAREIFAARRAQAAPAVKTCVRCDAVLTGHAQRWCPDCRTSHRSAGINTVWSRDLIIDRIQEWNRRYGRPPSAAEWNRGVAKLRGYTDALAVLDAEPHHWPAPATVCQHFGSWAEALRAAGLQPNRPGRRSGGTARTPLDPKATA